MAKEPVDKRHDDLAETLPSGSTDKAPRDRNFFSSPETVEHSDPPAIPEATQLGDYDLLGLLGEGGMGVVYRARQRSANRIVALKVIRPELISVLDPSKRKEAIERFQTEAQAAAQLDHDNIVTVYDVGEADGQQYFSMRYVDGESLAELLRDGPLKNRKAAEYIEAVARAVEDAHRHGVLHRDLKPQNILVDKESDRALVVDFGLAKLTEQDGELTRDGQIMGTPQYMAPEQASDLTTVTERSDVYSLGATLYHLLTGRPVFQAATPIETLRQVIDELPVPLRQLNPAIDRDLETICLKCLEKEPARRYDSAEQLGDELQCYLKGHPIKARPIRFVGRAWRWGKRNRLAASSIAAAFGFLVLALVVVTVAYVQTAAAHRRSEESFRQALDVVNVFFTRVSEETLLDQPGLQPLRQDLLLQARDYFEGFLRQRAGDYTIQDRLAETHYRVGLITAKIESPKKALDSYDRALAIQRQLVTRDPNNRDHSFALANTLNAKGDAMYKLGELDESLTLFRESSELRGAIVKDEPKNVEYNRKLANSHMNIGAVLNKSGKTNEGRREIEHAQAIRERLRSIAGDEPRVLRDLAKGYYFLGDLLSLGEPERYEPARKTFDKAVRILKQLTKLEDAIEDEYLLSICFFSLARTQPEDADDRAAKFYRQALAGADKLVIANPRVDRFRAQLARTHTELAIVEFHRDNTKECVTSLTRADQLLRQLVEKDPNKIDYQTDLVGVVELLTDLNGSEDDYLDRLRLTLVKLGEQFPDAEHFQTALREVEKEISDATEN